MTGTLVVGNFLSTSALNECVCEEFARRLAARGRTVITTSREFGKLARLRDMVATAWSERNRYGVACVDVFSGHAFLWAEAVCWTLRRAGRPYVLVLRGGALPGFARRQPRRVRALLGSAAAVVAPSRYLAEGMRPYCARLRLIPNPLHLPAYPFRLRSAPAPNLVWLRAFHDVYNAPLAVEVLARLPGARLAMYGPDKGSLDAVRRAAAELGVSGRLQLPGAVPKRQVPAALDAADIFLNTTDIDNTPVSVMEAMACGLAIVSTDPGGIRHLLEHERDALLVPPGNAAAMAAAVERILTEPGLAASLSANARRKAEGFDWSVVMPQWDRVLEGVAA
jgi:glycosyltransferase involved in cell wall biosynthesis